MPAKTYCRLCQTVGRKMAKAHVLPRSFYGDLLRPEDRALILVPPEGEFEKKSLIGVYDKELLCVECESQFAPLDDYAHSIFFERKRAPGFYRLGEPMAERIEGVDPSRLRLFFIFLIWRMHESGHEMFRGMKLGPYAERCRNAILQNNHALAPEIDACITRFTDDAHGGFLGPTRLRLNGVRGYRVHFVRHVCWVKVDKKPFLDPFDSLSIADREVLHIALREFNGSPERKAMVQHLKARRAKGRS